MAKVDPAVAHVLCPYDGCGEVVDLEIPVLVTMHRVDDYVQEMRAVVDQNADFIQPMWDHVLTAHGPKM